VTNKIGRTHHLPWLSLFPAQDAASLTIISSPPQKHARGSFFPPRSTPPPLHLDSLNPASRPPRSKPQRTATPLWLGEESYRPCGGGCLRAELPTARAEVTERERVQASTARSSRWAGQKRPGAGSLSSGGGRIPSRRDADLPRMPHPRATAWAAELASSEPPLHPWPRHVGREGPASYFFGIFLCYNCCISVL
jgi:hypothetical protein